MKITQLLRRRGHIYEVRFDDGTYINLDVSIVEQKNLAVGSVLSDAESFALEDESDLIRCTSRALYYLSRSGKSEKALFDKLTQAGFGESIVLKTVERMKELSYINDDDFAQRQALKYSEAGFSKKEIISRLIKAGISAEKAKEVCALNGATEQEKIRKLIEKKYKNKMSTPEDAQKTAAALARRGFLFSDIRAVLKEVDSRLNSGEYSDE